MSEPVNCVKATTLTALLAGCFSLRDKACVLLSADSGLRPGEIVALDMDCLNLTSDFSSVLIRNSRGNQAEYYRAISARAAAAIRKYIAKERTPTYQKVALFLSINGGRLTEKGLNERARRVSCDQKITPTTFWMLRNTWKLEGSSQPKAAS